MINAPLKKIYYEIPPEIRVFLKRAILIADGCILSYYVVLKPTRLADKPLTHATAISTVAVLNSFYQKGGSTVPTISVLEEGRQQVEGDNILLNGNAALFIADNCNALDVFMVYLAFLFCVPTTGKRVTLYAIAGVAGIFIHNVLRCYALTIIGFKAPAWLDFSHHYAFTFIVYSCIFFAWRSYSKKYKTF